VIPPPRHHRGPTWGGMRLLSPSRVSWRRSAASRSVEIRRSRVPAENGIVMFSHRASIRTGVLGSEVQTLRPSAPEARSVSVPLAVVRTASIAIRSWQVCECQADIVVGSEDSVAPAQKVAVAGECGITALMIAQETYNCGYASISSRRLRRLARLMCKP